MFVKGCIGCKIAPMVDNVYRLLPTIRVTHDRGWRVLEVVLTGAGRWYIHRLFSRCIRAWYGVGVLSTVFTGHRTVYNSWFNEETRGLCLDSWCQIGETRKQSSLPLMLLHAWYAYLYHQQIHSSENYGE